LSIKIDIFLLYIDGQKYARNSENYHGPLKRILDFLFKNCQVIDTGPFVWLILP